jgi:glutathione peroxidase
MFDNLKKTATSLVNKAVYGAAPTGGPTALDQIGFTRIDGTPLPATELSGKVLLFVNVASRCGLTPQYEGLVRLQQRYRDRGFLIVGAPCNQFLGQEPGSAEQIVEFCSATYGVDFPLLEKQDVNGSKRSPLYQWLIGSEAGRGDDIAWNFEKFLVGRDGRVVARFSPRTGPESAEVVAAIEAALA